MHKATNKTNFLDSSNGKAKATSPKDNRPLSYFPQEFDIWREVCLTHCSNLAFNDDEQRTNRFKLGSKHLLVALTENVNSVTAPYVGAPVYAPACGYKVIKTAQGEGLRELWLRSPQTETGRLIAINGSCDTCQITNSYLSKFVQPYATNSHTRKELRQLTTAPFFDR